MIRAITHRFGWILAIIMIAISLVCPAREVRAQEGFQAAIVMQGPAGYIGLSANFYYGLPANRATFAYMSAYDSSYQEVLEVNTTSPPPAVWDGTAWHWTVPAIWHGQAVTATILATPNPVSPFQASVTLDLGGGQVYAPVQTPFCYVWGTP
jgi:hypothetical protein